MSLFLAVSVDENNARILHYRRKTRVKISAKVIIFEHFKATLHATATHLEQRSSLCQFSQEEE